jgi:hypothetical protein
MDQRRNIAAHNKMLKIQATSLPHNHRIRKGSAALRQTLWQGAVGYFTT